MRCVDGGDGGGGAPPWVYGTMPSSSLMLSPEIKYESVSPNAKNWPTNVPSESTANDPESPLSPHFVVFIVFVITTVPRHEFLIIL